MNFVSPLQKLRSGIVPLIKSMKPIIPYATEKESKVFYYKMKGDYHRYMAEIATGLVRQNQEYWTQNAYDAANFMARKYLTPTNPLRLGLALSCAVFYYEILKAKDEACFMAQTTLDDANSELDTLDEESYTDAALAMQLLRDNLSMWTDDDDQGPAI